MVVGIRKSLEEGKVYSLEELSRRFGLRGQALERMVDHLMERGSLKPIVLDRPRICGAPVRLAGRFDYQLGWEA